MQAFEHMVMGLLNELSRTSKDDRELKAFNDLVEKIKSGEDYSREQLAYDDLNGQVKVQAFRQGLRAGMQIMCVALNESTEPLWREG